MSFKAHPSFKGVEPNSSYLQGQCSIDWARVHSPEILSHFMVDLLCGAPVQKVELGNVLVGTQVDAKPQGELVVHHLTAL